MYVKVCLVLHGRGAMQDLMRRIGYHQLQTINGGTWIHSCVPRSFLCVTKFVEPSSRTPVDLDTSSVLVVADP